MRAIFRTLLASGAVFGWGAGALATDLPAYRAAPTAALFSWSGFYLGGNAGYGWADVKSTATAGGVTASGSEKLNGFVGGGQAGVNWQNGNSVFGVETDIQGTSQSKQTTTAAFTETDQLPWFGTTRARLGWAADRWFLYGTGGVAYGEFTAKGTITGVGPFNFSETKVGWAAGAGVEAATSDHWSWKLEYLFVTSGTISKTFTVAGVPVAATARANDNIVRLGLNYRY